MGIKNLSALLNSKCQMAINKRNLVNYSGMIMGIDISIFLYKYLYNNDDHLEGITRLFLRILKNGIVPFVIFDGKPPKEKGDVLEDRKEKRDILEIKKNIMENIIKQNLKKEETQKKNNDEIKNEIKEFIKNSKRESFEIDNEELNELLQKNEKEINEEIEKTDKRIIYVTSKHIESTKNLCQYFGIPFIVSKGEAESLLGHLCREEILDGCISEDTDVLVNGGKIFLRSVCADKNAVDEYCLEGIMTALDVNYNEFIDICILCGCDYTTKINGMGPLNAHKVIKKYKTIEVFKEACENKKEKYIIPDGFDFIRARELFNTSSKDDNRDEIKNIMKMSIPKITELRELLKETKLHKKYFDEIDRNLMEYYKNIRRNNINNVMNEEFEDKDEKIIKKIKKDTTNNKKITDFFVKKE